MTKAPADRMGTPTATGYRVTCERCGWTKEYPKRASARAGFAGHKCKPTTKEHTA